MSTTPAQQAPARTGAREYRLGFGGVLKSEFLKYRTLASSWVLMGVSLVVMVGIAALNASSTLSYQKTIEEAQTNHEKLPDYYLGMPPAADLAYRAPAAGGILAFVIIASLAVVFVASEFGTKSIVSTFTATPRRGMVYLAKTCVLAVVVAVASAVSWLLSWAVVQLFFASHADLSLSLGDDKVLANLGWTVLVFVLTTLMGVGLAALLRNNAGAIVLAVVILFIMPLLLSFFTWQWVQDFTNYTPLALVQTMFNPTATGGDKIPDHVEAFWWYALWCVVPLVAGYVSFTRRDPK